MGRGMESPTTAGAGSTVDPELLRSREATTASSRSWRLRPGHQLLFPDHEQPKEESSHETGDDNVTISGARVNASGHAGPRDGQTIASTIVMTANGCSESTSALGDPGSGQKAATRSVETAHGQRVSVKSQSESAFVHATWNGPWSESAFVHVTWNGPWSESATHETGHATPETDNGHSDALHENLDLAREINWESVSGSGPR